MQSAYISVSFETMKIPSSHMITLHCFYLDVHNLYMLLCIENFSGVNLRNLS